MAPDRLLSLMLSAMETIFRVLYDLWVVNENYYEEAVSPRAVRMDHSYLYLCTAAKLSPINPNLF